MKLMGCRNLVLITCVVLATAGLGDRALDAQGTIKTALTVNVTRLTTLASQIWPADFNGDGFVDLAATMPAGNGASSGKVAVALGDGAGKIFSPVATSFAGHVVGVADIDGDGKPDLIAVGDPAPAALVVLPNTGNGTFGAARTVDLFDTVSFAAGADIDGDGKRDLVIVDQTNSRVVIRPGNGDVTFGPAVTLSTGAVPMGAAIADFNGDGRMDIAVAGSGAHSVSLFINTGSLLFAPRDIALDSAVSAVAAADISADGKVDLIATLFDGHDTVGGFEATAGSVAVMLGHGDGTFASPVSYTVARGPVAIVLADFTGDGILDIATGNRSALVGQGCRLLNTWDSVSVLPGNGNGTFVAASNFSVGNQAALDSGAFRNSLTSLTTADLDGDHRPDLIVSGGALFFPRPNDPNWPPGVSLNSSFSTGDTVVLRAAVSESDQDMVTYQWTASDGAVIPPVPWACVNGFTKTPGPHTYTVTVDDGHGHQTTASTTFVVEPPPPPSVSVQSPVGGTTIKAGTPFVVTWATGGNLSGIDHWTVQFASDGSNFSAVAECANVPVATTSCTWNDPDPPTTTARIMVIGSGSTPVSSNTVNFAIAGGPTGTLPNGWSQADVGAVGIAGSATDDGPTLDGESYTVRASGRDIWAMADAFHFAWKSVTGNFSIEARVDSLANSDPWAKAGLMVRASATDPASVNAALVVTPANGLSFQWRAKAGGSSLSTHGPAVTAPVWLRITRQQNVIYALYRTTLTDAWTVLDFQTINALGPTVDVGLPVTSHTNLFVTTATFSGVFLQPLPALQTFPIGGATGTLATRDGTNFTLAASGTDIWNASDSFMFFGMPIGDNAQMTLRVRGLGNTNAWAKAGVMIRESIAAGSRQADLVVSSAKGIAMQDRRATGGASVDASQVGGAAPVWLRIRRTEPSTTGQASTFTAWFSTDRVTWQPMPGSAAFPMAHDAMIGIALTSHSPGVETTAIVDDIRIER